MRLGRVVWPDDFLKSSALLNVQSCFGELLNIIKYTLISYFIGFFFINITKIVHNQNNEGYVYNLVSILQCAVNNNSLNMPHLFYGGETVKLKGLFHSQGRLVKELLSLSPLLIFLK